MGKIFNNEREYKSQYYDRKPTERQLNALKQWNDLQNRVGRKRALNIADAKKAVKVLTPFKKGDEVAGRGADAHATATKIFDMTNIPDRDTLRADENLLYGLMESPDDVITAAEASDSGYLSYQEMMQLHAAQLQARLDAMKNRNGDNDKPTPF